MTGPADFITHLTHSASAFIFSASLPPVQCATVLAAFALLQEEPHWHRQLWENVRYLLDSLASLGFDTGHSQTPVIPLLIRDPEKAMLFNKSILDRGVFASPGGVPCRGARRIAHPVRGNSHPHPGRSGHCPGNLPEKRQAQLGLVK